VGRALARQGFGLVTGGWVGVDKEVTQAFAQALQALGAPLSRSLKQIVPRPDQPAFFGGEVIYVDKGPQEWVETVRRAHAVILIGGLGGTYTTYKIAQDERVPVFPLAGTGGDARQAFDELLETWGQHKHGRVQREELTSLDVPLLTESTAEEVVDRLFELLNKELLGQAPPHPTPSKALRKPKALSKRERIDFLLVTALPEERDALLRKLPAYAKVAARKDDVHVYFRADLPLGTGGKAYRLVVLPLLGMGRVNAATATVDALKRWRPRHVVLVGIAGGIAERGVKVGDLLVSEQVVDYELQKLTDKGVQVRWSVHKASRRLYAAALNMIGDAWTRQVEVSHPSEGHQPRLHFGPIASGDKVIASSSVLAEYRNVWPALIGVEMEAAGVASACFSAARPPEFFMVRGVSDLADPHKDSAEVAHARPYACDVAATYVLELLRGRPIPLLRAVED
jgi:5'-methylthioadenosine/S-adenosylhomocysteine nucleosidase